MVEWIDRSDANAGTWFVATLFTDRLTVLRGEKYWTARFGVCFWRLQATTADAAKAEALGLVLEWCDGVAKAIRGT